MQTVHRNGTRVQRTPTQQVLRDRPYLAWRYMPLAAYLCERDYDTPMRDKVIDFIADGGFLESLVVDQTLWPEDLDGARAALESGRAWWARYSGRGVPSSAAIVPTELDPDEAWRDPTADADGDPIDRDDREAPAEPYEPTDADRDEWAAYLHEWDLDFDPNQLEAMREWYRTRPSFEEWLASQGGPRD
jgi:hypothetical protein